MGIQYVSQKYRSNLENTMYIAFFPISRLQKEKKKTMLCRYLLTLNSSFQVDCYCAWEDSISRDVNLNSPRPILTSKDKNKIPNFIFTLRNSFNPNFKHVATLLNKQKKSFHPGNIIKPQGILTAAADTIVNTQKCDL